MIYSDVIIVGGGPAGSSCAWKLRQHGIECLILDKQSFPRPKLCAGWITPRVIDDIKITANDYPFSLTHFDRFYLHIVNRELVVKVDQYAIRRVEFDDWLLKQSGVVVRTHNVITIKKTTDGYLLDDRYHCQYLVGAGGVHCPVYRSVFKPENPRLKESLVVTLEQEFSYDYQDRNCHLWFFQDKLPGYSWYVPKNNGYLNIGVGGSFEKLKANHDNIAHQWQLLVQRLHGLHLVQDFHFNPKGCVYYLRDSISQVCKDQAFLVGDAAGVATKDMGEGIGPAIQSGILAANAIATGQRYTFDSILQYSFPRLPLLLKLVPAYIRSFLLKAPDL